MHQQYKDNAEETQDEKLALSVALDEESVEERQQYQDDVA